MPVSWHATSSRITPPTSPKRTLQQSRQRQVDTMIAMATLFVYKGVRPHTPDDVCFESLILDIGKTVPLLGPDVSER